MFVKYTNFTKEVLDIATYMRGHVKSLFNEAAIV